MATTVTLSQPALKINSVDYSDQCTAATLTITAEVEANLEGLVGTTTTVEVYATNSTSPSATNPEYTITGAYLESFTPINASLGELQTVDLTFTGGTYARATT